MLSLQTMTKFTFTKEGHVKAVTYVSLLIIFIYRVYRQVLDLIKMSTLLCEIRLLQILRQIEVRSSMFKTGMELTDVFSFLRF